MQTVTSWLWHHGIDTVGDHPCLFCRSLEHLTGEIGYGHQGNEQYQWKPVLPLSKINLLEIYLHRFSILVICS